MLIEYDGHEKPAITDDAYKVAVDTGSTLVQVICEATTESDDQPDGVSFYALVNFVPRIGEQIRLENKAICKVDSIAHNTVTVRADDGTARFVMLVPTVHGTMVRPGKP